MVSLQTKGPIMSYQRVIPRDLFNESKLLKCMGQLSLLIHEGKGIRWPLTLNFGDGRDGFVADQDSDDGSLFCENLWVELGGELIHVASRYNSKDAYPLFFRRGDDEGDVFNDDGSLSNDFATFLDKLCVPTEPPAVPIVERIQSPGDRLQAATTEQWKTAERLDDAIVAVDVTRIPVMSADRTIPRKEQAALARKLFKQLGLRGISVTAPNYSMAQSVDVRLPETGDRERDMSIEEQVREILAIAFPNHDNRSDSQSDHYDYKWSIG